MKFNKLEKIICNKLIENGFDTVFAERVMISFIEAIKELNMIICYEKNHFSVFANECIYCHKTSEESGRVMCIINGSGKYYQCYPELCSENKEKWLPDNTKLKKD